MVALAMAIIWLLPKLTRAIPSSLVAIVAVSLLAFGLNKTLDSGLAAPGQSNVVLTVEDMLLTPAPAPSPSPGSTRLINARGFATDTKHGFVGRR
jgi:SulP family sulfate permease